MSAMPRVRSVHTARRQAKSRAKGLDPPAYGKLPHSLRARSVAAGNEVGKRR